MGRDLQVLLILLAAASAGMLVWAHVTIPRSLDKRFRQSLRAFGAAFEMRFPIHSGLTDRVCFLSREVGRQLGMSERVLRCLETAAQMRDAGLCAMPYRLGDGKPYEQWTAQEKAAYMKHSELSASMLEYIPSLKSLAPIVRVHHLPYRGPTANGSPPSDDLPIEARILKVVADYVWFERWQGDLLAADSLRQGTDTDYDPSVVRALFIVLTSGGVEGEASDRRDAVGGSAERSASVPAKPIH